MRLRSLVALLFLVSALPLAAEESDPLGKLLIRASENAAKGSSASTIVLNAKDGPQEILAFSWGISNAGSSHTGGGAGSGKAQFSDFSFVKRVDKSSPVLMQTCAQGKHIPQATVTLKDRKGNTYMVVKFEDVFISSYQTGGSSGDEEPAEALTLNFAKMTVDNVQISDPKS